MRRDVVVCALSSGAVLLEGWHRSREARMETFVIASLHKPLWEYKGEGKKMKRVDRDDRLRQLGVYPGAPLTCVVC